MNHVPSMMAVCLLVLFPLSRASAGEWELSTDVGPTVQMKSIAAARDAVWAGAGGATAFHNGEIYFFDGSRWSLQTVIYPGHTGRHQGAYALSNQKAWMVGYDEQSPKRGRIYSYYSGWWRFQTEIAYPSNVYLYDVYSPEYNTAWVAGNEGRIYRGSGGGLFWYVDTDTGSQIWNGIHGVDENNIWAVGGKSPAEILYYDGSDWEIQTAIDLGSNKWLRDVAAVGANDVWAAGDTGVILHYDGTGWCVFTDVGENVSSAPISARAAKNVWAGLDGSARGIYFYDGSAWSKQTDVGEYIHALDASALYTVWAGSDNGKLWVLNLPSTRGKYDYDGDGTSDIAVFRSGLWAVRNLTRLYLGAAADQAAPADFDGDGTTDVAVFRGASGLWAVRNLTRVFFGQNLDAARPGDYDGDGRDDFCVFRDSSGLWAVRGTTRVFFGQSGDSPVPGYYDADNFADVAVFRGSAGLWAVRDLTRVFFGQSGDTPVPADYFGDLIWNTAVFRSPSGLWAIRYATRAYFGTGGDSACPADYDGDAADDPGIFRDTSGLWAIRGISRIYYGTSGDIPVTR